MTKKIFLTFFLLFIFSFAISQILGQGKINIAKSVFKNSTLLIDPITKTPSNIRLAEDNYIPLNSFFNEYKKTFGLSDDNEIRSYKITTDKLGQTHHRYKQYYKGIELGEVQFILHEKNGMVFHANGKLIHNLNLNVTPSFSESEALQYALSYVNAESYMWENKKNEAYIKKEQSNPDATMHPKGILMLSAKNFDIAPENFHLIYRFDIYSEKPMDRYYVDVDANTGEIINKISRIQAGDVLGQGTSVYNGTVSLTVADTAITTVESSRWHLDTWNAYSGESWWIADPNLGNQGGYDNVWYEALDTDPISLSGDNLMLHFYHRYKVETPGGEPEGYNGWDGMNVRISTDGGSTWQVLQNPVPAYTKSSLYSFGEEHGEGTGIPGWAGELNNWTSVSIDLSGYAEQTIKIRFAFASDPGYSTNDGGPDLFGWQIDNISVTSSSGTLYSNDGNVNGITAVNLVKEVAYIEGNYRLRQYGRGGGIATYDAKHGTFIPLSVDFVDDDTNFNLSNSTAGVSVHWALENAYDFYLNNLNRNSFDDNGGKMIAYAHYDDGLLNASWDGVRMKFGDGTLNNNPVVSIDIVAHEFTHGITQYTAGLIYQNEQGALNESFSDIFGATIEFYTLGSEADWFIGEGEARFRSMSNPKQYGDPDTYFGENWNSTTSDNGGVHTNSGVQNFWYYLLSEGGSGVNDNGYSYSVTGLGIDQASQIAYSNLSNYLFPTSEYSDARLNSMYAAMDLFGENSSEFQSVVEAWNAVGVLKPAFVPTVGFDTDTINFSAEASVATDTVEVTITNYGVEVLEITDIQITGSTFQILNPPALPDTLDYDESITVKIVFAPLEDGDQAGSLSVSSNDPANPVKELILKGVGYTIAPAVDGQIYAVTTQASSLFLTLNQSDGTGSEVGSAGSVRLYGTAIQPLTGLVIATAIVPDITPLLKIDAKSGKGYEAISLPVFNIRAIAFDSNGDLYGATYSGDLYLINYETGDLTFIGQTGISTLSSLAINPLDNQLWGTPLKDDIYKIDKTNAQTTLVGNTGFTLTPAIAFDSEGKLYGSSGLSQTINSELIMIDTSDGTGTLIGSIGFKAVSGLTIKGSVVVSTNEKKSDQFPTVYNLAQNYPNPFNPTTKIKFTIPEEGTKHSLLVQLKVYDVLGNEVETLVNEIKPAGNYEINFDASGLSSGVYFYKLIAGDYLSTKKMLLIK